MPLVQCPECQKDVSSEALSCPQCAFPYPGKKERLNGKSNESLHACGDCGNIISKQAKSCPHCGSPSLHAQEVSVANKIGIAQESSAATKLELAQENSDPAKLQISQETWLCPNCGVPFTRRKGEKSKSGETRPQQLVSTPSGQQVGTEGSATQIAEARQDLVSAYRQKKEKRTSPLWGESQSIREEEPQYPRPRKKWSLFFLVMVSVLLVALASFAFWQLKGLNPLEALVYWQM